MTGEKAVPNILTSARLVLAIVMWLFLATAAGQIPFLSDLDMMNGPMQFELQKWAFVLFILAALTDFFDGLLARRWHAESLAGAVLDPIADKILVCGAILGLLSIGAFQQDYRQFVVPAALILFREFAVSGLREVMAARGIKLPVTLLAKWKTTVQLVALGATLFVASWPALGLPMDNPNLMELWANIAHVLMWVAAVISLWTGAEYLIAARRAVKAQAAAGRAEDAPPRTSAA